MTRATVKSHTRHGLRLHPLPLRIMHWTNAVAMIIMIGSGWKIYNDEVLFGWLHFPDWITIGGEAQGALQWHFLGMWILAINGIAYLIYGLVSGRFRRMLLPIRLRELIATVREPCVSTSRTTISPATTPCSARSMSASSWSAFCR
jgi:Thiosulfate reductase cytochrome B subunit (membrane anchoring protein)